MVDDGDFGPIGDTAVKKAWNAPSHFIGSTHELSLAETFDAIARDVAPSVRPAPGAARGADNEWGVACTSIRGRSCSADVGPIGGGNNDAGTSTPETHKSPIDAQGGPAASSNAIGQSRLGPVRSRYTGSIRFARYTDPAADATTALENTREQALARARIQDAVL